MPWYYAGPEAKPVGPVTLEELHARRVNGTVKSDTYVIEHTGQPTENWAWKRYQEVFPSSASLPPIPPQLAPPITIPAPPAPQPQGATTHPLFPSASPVPHSVFPHAPRPDPYYTHARPTNGLCAWGFGLGLAGLIFSFACGIGVFLALIALPLCILGLSQLHKHHEQAGRGLAVAGLILSGIALVISLIFILSLAIPMIKAHQLTVMEQTSNDSE